MPPVRDVALAAAIVVGLELDVWLLEDPRGPRWVTACAAAVFGGAVALRRTQPMHMSVIAATTIVAASALDGWLTSMLTTAVGAMIVTFSVAAHSTRRRAIAGAGVFLAASWADIVIAGLQGDDRASDLVFTAVVVVGLPWLAGRALRERTERARELEELTRQLAEEREQRAQVAVLDERNRIAREMHDVVAHSVSLMVVQAGAARRMLDSDVERSRSALLAIESAGRDALAELRRVLGVLRGSPEPVSLQPQPGTAQLTTLVDGIRRLGLDVAMTEHGTPRPVPPGVELTVYRVVQEALTNAVKHARGAHARVTLTWAADALDVSVEDDGTAVADGTTPGGGHGLAGMRERVAVYGGRLEAGARAGGGFAVHARIPLDGAAP